MDQEKNTHTEAESEASDMKVTEAQSTENILVPDDAFATNDTSDEEDESAELLPQSLEDDDFLLDDTEDPLFTDEELDSIVKKAAVPYHIDADTSIQATESKESEDASVLYDCTHKNPSSVAKARTIDSIFDILEMFVLALAFVLIAMAFCFRHSVVDGPSMMNTLQNGEHLIISSLFYSPEQGDIVVVQDASNKKLAKPIVKRIIATEGQTVKILYDTNREENLVYVDGVLLDEKYVYIDEIDYKYDYLEMTVPEGCVFLMGDHRNNSADSRGVAGAFREEAILGKAVLRFLPIQRFGAVK